MWGLTRQEQRVALFLLTTFAIGCVVLWWRQQRPAPPVPQRVLKEFAERSAMALPQRLDADALQIEERKASPAPLAPVDINTATATELMKLPGIGAVMAQRIVDYRSMSGSFSKTDDLLKVKGIGKKTFEKLAPFIVVK